MKNFILISVFMVLAVLSTTMVKAQTVVWSEDFEGNWTNDWYVDNGVWEVGVPTTGPSAPHGGTKCAATVLNGNYPPNANTRLIRYSSFAVPAATENPRLRLWHWFSFSSGDYGKVQIKVVGTTDWYDLSEQYLNVSSDVWSCPFIDLSSYAGQTVQIAFYFYSDGSSYYVSTGWYIDDVSFVTGPVIFNNPEGWENGIGDWGAEKGTWETGQPTAGPANSHTGQKCAGTNLKGNYAANVESRFISPTFTVPNASENPRIRFWHWFSFSSGDYSKVQIKVVGATDWYDLSGQYKNVGSNTWSCPYIDLSDYAGLTVQIAFYFYSDGSTYYVSTGWYIDDLSLVTGPVVFNTPEGWESGIGDWGSESGTWEVGQPTAGPATAHTGQKCAGTSLQGNYAANVESRFVSPPFTIPDVSVNPLLRFWHWFSFSSGDYGKVQIKPVSSSIWTDLSSQYLNTSGNVWTNPLFELSAFAGQTVQIAFYFYSDGSSYYVSTGWYIDDFEIDNYVPVIKSSISQKEKIQIYPNPLKDMGYIVFPNVNHSDYQLFIFDICGKLVMKKGNIDSERISIDMGYLNPGIYFIKLVGEKIFDGNLVVQ
jgi:bacillopeptidase F (M6 metalloprotease family)